MDRKLHRRMAGEAVAVDSGAILIIDPCLLFSEREWAETMDKALDSVKDFPTNDIPQAEIEAIREAVLEALAAKFGFSIESAVLADTVVGDGRFPIERMEEGILIRT